ncbi:hypothetical protein V5O48_015927 [Marasmius crinis-equi]|uniref:AAA-ATPase-like domain-containing protein n=1 Tax=Marasmius crinis-equi TaxID=585013 RepID=A0ABR3ET80_9AGAR
MTSHPCSVKRKESDDSIASTSFNSNYYSRSSSPSQSISSGSSSSSSESSKSGDPELWSSDSDTGTIPSSPFEQRDSEQTHQLTLPKPASPSACVVYLEYSKETLSSPTTDFKTLVDFLHFRDRTRILKFTNEHQSVLFRTPHGYGKTSAISMLNCYYDFRLASTFKHNFQCTEASYDETWEHNGRYVWNLDFGQFSVEDRDFDLDEKLNSALEKFVEDYSLFSSIGDVEIHYQDPIAAQTFNNLMEKALAYAKPFELVICIDDYDVPYWDAFELESVECRKVHETLGKFFHEIGLWTFYSSSIPLVFLTGQTNILSSLPGLRRFPVFDIKENDPDGALGFNEDDVRSIGGALNARFHSLGLDAAADAFFKSEEAIEAREDGHLEYPCDMVLDFYHGCLKHAAREVESMPALRVPTNTT